MFHVYILVYVTLMLCVFNSFIFVFDFYIQESRIQEKIHASNNSTDASRNFVWIPLLDYYKAFDLINH